ncbi:MULTISPECIES: hypothetical protein [unclassified Photobacterium]|uniref:hypothetical protein n=1 Tax=unclassified Photobacterium TaxID=2628852 RepID=UPI000D16A821|nr:MULTISPECIES: hypothetical protein [unclassified Photobacterium]PSV41097.1 hypothetical protein C9J38_03430 [Photobacterium sp. GB-210]PSV50846.1 hypothetical protein C9J45_18050 [Photobacterium sp. GB-1]
MGQRHIVFYSIVITIIALVVFALREQEVHQQSMEEKLASAIKKQILPSDKTLPNTDQKLPYYLYGRADLNNNGKDETFVLMQSERYCEKDECKAYLFDDQYQLMAKWEKIQQPVLVGNDMSNGWKDILLTSDNQTYLIKYVDKTYNENITTAAKHTDKAQALEAVGLAINSEYYQANGTNLELDYNQPIFDCQTCYLFSYEELDNANSQQHYLAVNVATGSVRRVNDSQNKQ